MVEGVPVEESLDLAPLLEDRARGAMAEKMRGASRRLVPHTATELEAMRLTLPESTAPQGHAWSAETLPHHRHAVQSVRE